MCRPRGKTPTMSVKLAYCILGIYLLVSMVRRPPFRANDIRLCDKNNNNTPAPPNRRRDATSYSGSHPKHNCITIRMRHNSGRPILRYRGPPEISRRKPSRSLLINAAVWRTSLGWPYFTQLSHLYMRARINLDRLRPSGSTIIPDGAMGSKFPEPCYNSSGLHNPQAV